MESQLPKSMDENESDRSLKAFLTIKIKDEDDPILLDGSYPCRVHEVATITCEACGETWEGYCGTYPRRHYVPAECGVRWANMLSLDVVARYAGKHQCFVPSTGPGI